MSEDLDSVLVSGYELMHKSLEHLNEELSKVRAGKASPAMLGSVFVDYYGANTPLSQVANITNTDARTLSIQPWEKKMIAPIERAIFEANLGFTPMNNGEVIMITVPPLTEERRQLLVKQTKGLGEDAKVAIRTTRQKLMDTIKKEVKDGLAEDLGKRKEAEVQKHVDEAVDMVGKYLDAKKKDIMKV
ncbi:MAG: ribosome recycling factor [Saprospiraceae bacterium]|nr:ribosome recycling factor [Saprospiraceae bacterium]